MRQAIRSDEPQAIEKLIADVQTLEKLQADMKAANKIVKGGTGEAYIQESLPKLSALGISERQARKLWEPDFCGRVGFPDYALTNNSANIRRLKKRIDALKKISETPETEIELKGCVIKTNKDLGRLQILFPDKPAVQVREALKSHGFKWSPTEMAWQRMITPVAMTYAQNIINKFY